mgnify:CR=1 FL=1
MSMYLICISMAFWFSATPILAGNQSGSSISKTGRFPYLLLWNITILASPYFIWNPGFSWMNYPPTSLHQIPELNLIFLQRNDDDMSEMTHFHVHFDLEIVSDRKPILKILGTLTQKKSKPFQASSHSWQIVSKKGVVEGTKTYPVIRNNSPAYRVPVKKAWISLPYTFRSIKTLAPRF